ncbi:MAG TPA: hypothetical protein VGE02_07465 [Gemmatimonadales bacterium]
MIQEAQAPAAGQAMNEAELARQLETSIRTAVQSAQQQAARAGQQAPPPPLPPEGAPFRIQREDGSVVEVGPGGVKVLPAQTGQAAVEITPEIPPEAVVISIAFFVMIAVILIGWPISRALARRMDRASAAPQRGAAGDPERLVRIEQAIEAMAIEVERISENQRFVTKLLADGRQLPDALPSLGAAEGAAAARVEGERR